MKFLCNVMLMFFLSLLAVDICEASYCTSKTYVFHGNGMYTEKWEAESNLVRMQQKIVQSSGQNFDNWKFQLSYNHDEGKLSILEVFRQRMGDQTGSFWRWLGGIDSSPDWFKEAALRVASGYDLAESIIDEDLREHVQRYESLLMQGDRVLVVAHSQGNLYANAAYANLAAKGLPMDAFGIVSVANPASRVAGDGPYFTLVNDLVISAVRWLFPNTLEGNVEDLANLNDWTNHSFVESYLNGNTSGPIIINSILQEANALSWPDPEVGKGPITVMLTWQDQPDVDLHIFEPTLLGHVWYSDPVGEYGYLDQDARIPGGVEHYFVESCEQLKTGLFGVGVNYYRGSGPVVAEIQIQAGDSVRNFNVLMNNPMGSLGNYRAWNIAAVRVSEEEGVYNFQIEDW